jgi:hypothetical protein
MYCNHCGVQIPADARFCPNCQAANVAVARPAARVANQLTLLSSLWFAMGALRLLAAIGVFIMGSVMLPMILAHAREPMPFPMHALMAGIGVFVGLTALLTFVTGWGLYKREPWGRTLALVMGFVSLLSIPFGTALGIYTLVVLLPSDADVEWRELSK